MCGFAGYRFFHDGSVDESLIHVLSKTLNHRGPDDEGFFVDQNARVVLVARRLSIIDLSQTGKQPMMDEDGSLIIMFNGEIYNYRILKQELQEHGCIFRSHSDTEVVLHAFKTWGIECLNRFDGEFAFVLYNRQARELYLVRDRIGVKPLYFSTQGSAISFASEIKALWKLPWINRQISVRGLSHYLTYLATPAPMTLFEGIYKLPAGFYAKVDTANNISFTQWYDPLDCVKRDVRTESKHSAFSLDEIRKLLQSAVSKRMIADVPVGALLSGGLDSSLVVAFMKQHSDAIKTFTVAFDQDPYEERRWARKIAKKFNTDHHELIITEQDAFAFFSQMVYHQDEPLGDVVCIPLYYVSKLARDAGIKVLQVGEGADELFGGYPLYANYLALYRYWKMSQQLVPRFARQAMFYAARPFYEQYPNRQDLMKSWADGRQLFWGSVCVFSELWKQELIEESKEAYDPIVAAMYPDFPQNSDSYAVADYYRSHFYNVYPLGDFFALMTYIELKHRLPELILTRTDKMTMAASVEARVPYLDHRLVEYMLQVPAARKFDGVQAKCILKKIAESLVPHEIINRKKIGFSVPVQQWFKQGCYFKPYLADMIHSRTTWHPFLNHQKLDKLLKDNAHGSIDYAYQLWALQNVLAF